MSAMPSARHSRTLPTLVYALALAAAFACVAPAKRAQPPAAAGPSAPAIRIRATPVPLYPGDPARVRSGDFVYAGGFDVTSPDTDRLHGLSDLKIDARGGLTAVGDDGELFRARLVLDQDGRLADLAKATLERLTGLDGQPLSGKAQADAEGVALWPNGDLMVSFERDHRIWLYPAGGGSPRPVPRPQVAMPDNAGMEGLSLAPAAGADAYWVGVEGGEVFLCHLATACAPMPGLPQPEPGWRLSALAETPAGQLVLLHQRFSPLTGLRNHLLLIEEPRAEAPRAPRVAGDLTVAPPETADNFEGVAPVTRPDGGLRLYLLSDDNFSNQERTLLLAFDWQPSPNKSDG
jgi:hypothetical protein